MTTATVLAKGADQKKLDDRVSRVLERYDSFVLVDASDDQIRALRNEGFSVITSTQPKTLNLGGVTIDTAQPRFTEKGILMAHPSYANVSDPGPDDHHYIVQFIGPKKEEWAKQIKGLGGDIKEPLPSHSYIIEMNGQTRDKVVGLPFVKWVGHYDPAYRLVPGMLEELEKESSLRNQPQPADTAKATGEHSEYWSNKQMPLQSSKAIPFQNTFLVSFQSSKNMEEARSKIQELGGSIATTHQKDNTLTVSLPAETADVKDKLIELASIHGVRTIDSLRLRQLRNDIATRIMTGTLGVTGSSSPYMGDGEIIAVADTGLDTGDQSTIHKDFRGRIAGITSWPISPSLNGQIKNPGGDDGPADLDSSHGTHVAGSVLGNGTTSIGMGVDPIRGLSYKASIFFQAIEQRIDWKSPFDLRRYGKYVLAGLPDDLTLLFKQAYDAGARIQTNSWGGGQAGAYDDQCRDVDQFLWENKDLVILFAAGNDGSDTDNAGKVTLGSISPPATSKNCIAVGASENKRDGAEFDQSYGQVWRTDFPVPPISDDKIADDPSDIAAFSSRGPCQDKRFKPDVVAPGTFILSTKSTLTAGEPWKPYSNYYMYMGGTSMAAPLTAGAVGVIREYLRKTNGAIPSSALIRAALIHTAQRLPYRFAASDPGQSMWDPEQGWGHVNLKPFIEPDQGLSMKFIDSPAKFNNTGESWTGSFAVTGQNHPVKVTLVYTDYPGLPNTSPSLVNNLNLIVTAPDGRDYYGNAFDNPNEGSTDSVNNVESVLINNPQTGTYTIKVWGAEVKTGPQDFALVYSGEMSR